MHGGKFAPAQAQCQAFSTNAKKALTALLCITQAQRARTALLQEIVNLMSTAGIDAFIGNTSEELAMANLASLPTMAVPLGTQPLKDAPDSPRKRPTSLGIFGSPQTDANVRLAPLTACNYMMPSKQQPSGWSCC